MTMAFFAGGMPGMGELAILALLLIILFGAKRLPRLARALGASITEFKRGRTLDATDMDMDGPDA